MRKLIVSVKEVEGNNIEVGIVGEKTIDETSNEVRMMSFIQKGLNVVLKEFVMFQPGVTKGEMIEKDNPCDEFARRVKERFQMERGKGND